MRFCFAPTSSSPSYRSTRCVERVLDDELGHGARLVDLGDAQAPRERLVERDVVGDRVAAGKERGDDDAAVLHGVAELEGS